MVGRHPLPAFDPNGFEVGALGGYRFGRDEDDADRLKGLGDVDGGLVVGGYAAYNFGGVKPFVSYHHQVTGDDAGGLRRAPRRGCPIGRVTVLPCRRDLRNDDYMDAYFTVTAAQAAASPRPCGVYDADAASRMST